ncbi:MAG: glycosyltransferase [Solirubrobacterales bacterium]|nr:glycosyltransferase [Solirubrobacterales bacterium]
MNEHHTAQRADESPSPIGTRADLHCHSTASQLAKLGVQRAMSLPECATPPEEVYRLAKERGMDFVTITDHDTIDGVLSISDLPDVFISEELTVWFADEPQAVHVLCFGIDPDDHAWLQRHNRDVCKCAAYLQERGIACALAHPFFHVAEPLTARHRRTLAALFPVWETRNGMRAPELNAPAALYIDTHGGVAVGGSDDHAGIDIGRTYTQAPPAATPDEFLEHLRAGRVVPGGQQGSPAKLAHSAIVLAARSFGASLGAAGDSAPDPVGVFGLIKRVMLEAHSRRGAEGSAFTADDARRLLTAWLTKLGFEARLEELLATFKAEGSTHAAVHRRARRAHERDLNRAAARMLDQGASQGLAEAGTALFEACLPAVPYLPASGFLARERDKLTAVDGDPPTVAVIADGVANVHGVAHTLVQLRERGVEGYEIDVIGTDANVDRRLTSVLELELPQYPGLELGVPSLLAISEALSQRHYDLVHVCAPGPAGIGAALVARAVGLPLVGSYHTELQAYARSRTGDARIEQLTAAIVSAFYGQCEVVLSPSPGADASLAKLGIDTARMHRWARGVDHERFNPGHRTDGLLPGTFNVLYAGRLSSEKGIDLLAESFLIARDRDPRLHLVLAGGGPEERSLRGRLGSAATFLGWLEDDELARAYASADLFVFASTTDTFGQVILEAQASGLPVLAVDEGGHVGLIENGHSGCLVQPEPWALADAIRGIARREVLRSRLAAGGLSAIRERSWERSMNELGAGYARALRSALGAEDGRRASASAPLATAA